MSATLVKEITFILKTFISEERMFTLVDVSREIQKNGSQLPHSAIRELAKPIADDVLLTAADWYTSETIQIPTPQGVVSAILYRPEWEDSEEYVAALKPKLAKAAAPVLAPAAPVAASAPAQVTGQVPSCAANAKLCVALKYRADGRVEIPQAALTTAELTDLVSIINHPNSISIVDGDEKGAIGVRLTLKDLAASNLTGKQLFACAFGDKVVICAA